MGSAGTSLWYRKYQRNRSRQRRFREHGQNDGFGLARLREDTTPDKGGTAAFEATQSHPQGEAHGRAE